MNGFESLALFYFLFFKKISVLVSFKHREIE